MVKYRLTRKGKSLILIFSLMVIIVPITFNYTKSVKNSYAIKETNNLQVRPLKTKYYSPSKDKIILSDKVYESYKDKTLILSINFSEDDARIGEEYFYLLDEIVNTLNSRDDLVVFIEGYVADFPKGQYTDFGQKLSLDRANSIKNYLEEKGIKSKKINVSGLGIGNQLSLNDAEENAKQNRRAEIYIVSKN